jgi:adenosylcobinamide-GDP ribazoletransferase
VPRHLSSVLLLLLPLLLTGGLHADGFMDTMDGVFSGRSRERKLEIMKDSRVGANGVTSFVLLLLLNWAILLDMPPFWLVPALFVMPVIGRCMMVGAITCFPYARPEGMGKAFAEYAGKKSLWLAFFLTVVCVAPWGPLAGAAFLVSAVFTVCFARYITGVLGGLTGDVYGALTLLNEVLVLLVFLLGSQVVG